MGDPSRPTWWQRWRAARTHWPSALYAAAVVAGITGLQTAIFGRSPDDWSRLPDSAGGWLGYVLLWCVGYLVIVFGAGWLRRRFPGRGSSSADD